MAARIAGGFVLSLVLLVVGTAPALAICDPHRPGYFEGARFSGVICGTDATCSPNIIGVPTDFEATIAGYTPYVDFAHSGSVSAWPMLADKYCASAYLQGGNLELWHPWSEIFWEAGGCGYGDPGPHEYNPGSGCCGGAHHIKIQWAFGTFPGGTFSVIVDVTTIATGTTDWTPNRAESAVETHSQDDQNYGGYQAPQFIVNFTTCDFYSGTNHCYVPGGMETSPTFTGNTPAWMQQGFYNSSHNDFYMYDTACTN
jgi:hypothetical protein